MSSPLNFIAEEISVEFERPPMLEKAPTCPDGFTWRDERFQVVELLEEWHDFRRRGPRNMRPAHLSRAEKVGSWGKGRFCFRVRVQDGRIFEMYYDRAPGSASDRKGHWFLLGERKELGE
jgi:hypothetical protein